MLIRCHAVFPWLQLARRFIGMSATKKFDVPANSKGEFVRPASVFRNWVTADGSSGFKAEKGRYHLFVSLACPWASRCLVMRHIKGLEDAISFTVVDWFLGVDGWTFTDKKAGCTLDPFKGFTHLRQYYQHNNAQYDGRVTVPVLWDKQKDVICSNESAEIIIMMNKEFNEFCATEEQRNLDLYQVGMKTKIDEMNDFIYPRLNNGVYRSGFAKSQEAYDGAVNDVFEGLEKIESLLKDNRFLLGDQLTLADVRCFTSLVRFDWVYHTHFKCNVKKLIEYPNTNDYMRDIYNIGKVKDTVNRDHIVNHYFSSMVNINPFRIVAKGPQLDLSVPNERRKKFGV